MRTVALSPAYLCSAEAAEYLGVTSRTLARWRRTGCGPKYTRLGRLTGRVRYERAELDHWMQARQHSHTVAERTLRSQAAADGLAPK